MSAHKISPRIGSLLAIEKKPDLIKKENTISSRIRSLLLLRLKLNVLSPSLCFLIKLTCCLAPISLLHLSKDARGRLSNLLIARSPFLPPSITLLCSYGARRCSPLFALRALKVVLHQHRLFPFWTPLRGRITSFAFDFD